jgi:hypothetical protein
LDRLVKSPHIGLDALVGGQRFIGGLIPSPIEANNDSFHTSSPGNWSNGVLEHWSNGIPDPAIHHVNTPLLHFIFLLT